MLLLKFVPSPCATSNFSILVGIETGAGAGPHWPAQTPAQNDLLYIYETRESILLLSLK